MFTCKIQAFCYGIWWRGGLKAADNTEFLFDNMNKLSRSLTAKHFKLKCTVHKTLTALFCSLHPFVTSMQIWAKQITRVPAEDNVCWYAALQQLVFEGAFKQTEEGDDWTLQGFSALHYLLAHHGESVFKRQRPARGGWGGCAWGRNGACEAPLRKKRARNDNTAWWIHFWQKVKKGESERGKGRAGGGVEGCFRLWWSG